MSGGVTDASPVRVAVNGVEAAVSGATFAAAGVAVGDGPTVSIALAGFLEAGSVVLDRTIGPKHRQ